MAPAERLALAREQHSHACCFSD
ncbi:hypothetical protein DFAR_3220004 [Desulfarculales bacterium]